jgi:hypothetical protein
MIIRHWEDSKLNQTEIMFVGNVGYKLKHLPWVTSLGNSSHGNSRPGSIEWEVSSQAFLSSTSVHLITLPSLVDMMMSIEPSAFLSLWAQK